jgi:PA domain
VKRACLAAAALLAGWPAILCAGAHITIVNGDAAGQGLNDPTPATPVGGNPGTTLGEQRLNAMQRVADIWSALLDSPVEIRIQVHFTDLGCTATTVTLAQTGPIQVLSDFTPDTGFPGPEFPGTWYPSALASRRAGHDLLPGNPNTNADDVRTTINSKIGQSGCGFDFYYGYDGQSGSKVDLVETILHEFVHGFGFVTLVTLSTGAEFQAQPDVFERNILDDSTGKLWPAMSDAERAASAINTGNVVWAGSGVTASAPGVLLGTPTLRVSAPAAVAGNYAVGVASFGPTLTAGGVAGALAAALDPADANGMSTFDACSAISNGPAIAGHVALVDRGTCTFVTKAKNVQAAGAIAMVVADNVDSTSPDPLGGTDPTVTIPAVRVTRADGATLRASVDAGVTLRLFLDSSRLAGADSANHVRLYAPNPIQSGSSISHWDTTVFPELLMEPTIGSDSTHGVDLTLSALRDIGWYSDLLARAPVAPLHRPHTAHVQPPRP